MPDILLNPNVVYILLMAGALLAMMALATPGTGLLELGAFFLIVVAGYGLYTLSFNWWSTTERASTAPSGPWRPSNRRGVRRWCGSATVRPEHDLARYNALARELGVSFQPRIHSPDAEVVSLLSRATAIVYTSRLEPFGLAPLEAEACGTMVVGIAEGGVRESIVEGVNGELARDDDPRVLGELIGRLVDDRALAVRLGARAREHVQATWTLGRCTDNIEALLSEPVRRH